MSYLKVVPVGFFDSSVVRGLQLEVDSTSISRYVIFSARFKGLESSLILLN